MHVEAPDHSKLRDFHNIIKALQQRLGNALLFLAEDEYSLGGESVVLKCNTVRCLLEAYEDPAVSEKGKTMLKSV